MSILTIIAFYGCFVSAAIKFTLEKKPNPTPDESTAYIAIENSMNAAVKRYNKFVMAEKSLKVMYVPSVRTADGSQGGTGTIRFGSNAAFQNERTALHEISHTLGVGLSPGFNRNCKQKTWYTATSLLRKIDKPDSQITCGGGHFWPYGLNYDNEFSQKNADSHCRMIQAMINDGM